MSLILEALKKIEREKEQPRGGTLVVAPATWAAPPRRSRAPIAFLLVVATLAFIALAGLVLRMTDTRTRHSPTASPLAQPAAVVTPHAVGSTAPRLLDDQTTPAIPPAPTPERASLPLSVIQPTPKVRTKPSNAVTPRYRLNAISQQDGHPIALLNDRVVREGDVFDGARVVKIGETTVALEVDGQTLVVGFQ
ncbi:MAG: hypothetical protein MUF51_03215 [Vicinamibacteria bacterium]|jgi:hypothetical protein|nr:hypothetical protein [Vicinamibacteria bacterium]